MLYVGVGFTKLAFDSERQVWALGNESGEVCIGTQEFVSDVQLNRAGIFKEPTKVRGRAVNIRVPASGSAFSDYRLPMRTWTDGRLTFAGAFDFETHQWFVVD